MDGIYDQQYNMGSYDQSTNVEPGATFGEYISTSPNLGTTDNQTYENFGEFGNFDSYKNNVVTKLAPVTIGAYPTSTTFPNYYLNGIEPISSTTNYDDYTNVNTFQDINTNSNSYDNNGTYTNMDPIISNLPSLNDGFDSTTSNNIDYKMDSNINGNYFPIVSNDNIISSDNLQYAGSDGQYNELFNTQELVSSQNEGNDAYLSSYKNDTASYQPDYNSSTWTDIPSTNDNAYETQNLNIDSNEQIPLYNLNTSIASNDYKYGSDNYQVENNYNNTSDYADYNDNLGEAYPSSGEMKSYSVHSQPIYTKPKHTSITLPPRVMVAKDEIDYIPVKKTKYIKKTKTKVFIPTKKTIIIPKIKKVIIPKKKIIYVSSPNRYSSSVTVLPPRVSTTFAQNSYTSPIRYNYQRNNFGVSSINNVTSTPMPPVRYNITSIPVVTSPSGSYGYSSPIKSYNATSIPATTYIVDSIPVTSYNATTSIPATTYKVDSIPVTTYNATTSIPATTYKVDSIPVNNYNATTSIPTTTYKIDSIPVNNYNATTSIPTTTYKVDSIPVNNYNITSIPKTSYKVTSIPVNSYNATSSNTYNIEPTPVTNYNITPIPKESYNLTTSPIKNYNVTSIPANSYNITSSPIKNYNITSIPKYNVTSIPVNSYNITSIPKYNVTSIPVNSYNITSYPSKYYNTNSIHASPYKVDSIRVSKYNVTSFPTKSYNIASIPKYNVTSIPMVTTPVRNYSVASNRYSTYSVRSYSTSSNPVDPLRASREIEVSRVVTPLRRRSLYRNRIYHVDTLSSKRRYHRRRRI